MASRAAILRAARNAPAAAQPTFPPQGASPYLGRLPSYVTEPGNPYQRMYGPFLPRPAETFTQGAFGPMSPILPVPIDQPPPGAPRADPRRWQYYVGYNLPVGEPGTEGYKLTSFSTLKSLSDNYSILRTCLERRKAEIRALEWDIALTPDAAKAYQGHQSELNDFSERRALAKRFFRRPDPEYFTFESFLNAVMEQVFVYDALSLFFVPKRGSGLGRGLLGSDLDHMWLLDGTAIRPLMGLHGETPLPPAPAYSQYAFGVPRVDMTTVIAGLDLEEAGLDERDVQAQLRGDQLLYYPYNKRADSPYGFPLVEQALIPIMTGLRKQAYQLDFFDERTTPRVYISPGDTTMGPNQIRELQDALNAVASDIGWAFKVQVLPPGSKVMPVKEMEIVDQADEWIAGEVAMACDINPMEIGLLPKVSTVASPFAAREMAQSLRSIHQRTSTKPTLSYVTGIFDFVLQEICRQDDMRFVFDGMEETQDIAALTDTLIKQIQSGVKSIDEGRNELHLPPWGLPETSQPVVFTQMGPVPLGQAASDTVSQIRSALTGDHGSPGASSAVESLGRRAVASGQAPRKALPPGTSGQGRMNGPVTQRQARRGGALAPAHATGEGAPGHSGGKPVPKYADVPGAAVSAATHGSFPVAPGLNKAALAELEALGRHLRKGMPAAEWVPEHIPGHVMAIIADDLGKGLSAGYVIAQAEAQVGKLRPAHPRQRRQQQSQQQRQMQQLAQQYQAQVRGAFQSALTQAQALFAAWAAGTLAVTAMTLASMIADLIRNALLAVLTLLWTAAFNAGVKSAGGDPASFRSQLEAFLATEGANWASLISGTGEQALIAAIRDAVLSGDPASAAQRLGELFGVDDRSEQIAVSEVTRAWNAGAWDAGKAAGIAFKGWLSRNDDKVCPACLANQRQGPVPFDAPFRSGALKPPQHVRCRCRLVFIVSSEPFTGKFLRREIDLNGQEHWTEWEPDPDYSGGRVVQPHDAAGTWHPGAMTGGEPPRWDGTEPEPVVERAPGADDSAAYGDHQVDTGSRPGAYWPATYMDGYWPQGGHGMTQPPTADISAQTSRSPNPAGKSRDAAARFLKGAPRAKAADVRKVMSQNFPDSALGWVGRTRWAGPVEIPLDLIDADDEHRWAASHEQAHVDRIAADMKAGKPVNPVIGVVRKGHNRIRMVDGRHRYRAAKKNGTPVTGYVGFIADADVDAAYDTYHSQRHSGDSPQNKSFTAVNAGQPGAISGLVPFDLQGGSNAPRDESSLPSPPHGTPYCAGLVVRAADTGRVLMLQRYSGEPDDGAGLLEWPGGHADEGEPLLAAALREWSEEVSLPAPAGDITGHWESSNGVYEGFVMTIPSEAALDLRERGQIANPDGDAFEAVVWLDPAHLGGNRAVRDEVKTDLPLLLAALNDGAAKSARGQSSAEVLREYWRGEAHPGPTMFALEKKIRWGEPGDWYRCVDEVTPYLGAEGSKGYCNLRHKEVTGMSTAEHARLSGGGKH